MLYYELSIAHAFMNSPSSFTWVMGDIFLSFFPVQILARVNDFPCKLFFGEGLFLLICKQSARILKVWEEHKKNLLRGLFLAANFTFFHVFVKEFTAFYKVFKLLEFYSSFLSCIKNTLWLQKNAIYERLLIRVYRTHGFYSLL